MRYMNSNPTFTTTEYTFLKYLSNSLQKHRDYESLPQPPEDELVQVGEREEEEHHEVEDDDGRDARQVELEHERGPLIRVCTAVPRERARLSVAQRGDDLLASGSPSKRASIKRF